MSMVNIGITSVFGEIAGLPEVQGASTFRMRVYRNAPRRKRQSTNINSADS